MQDLINAQKEYIEFLEKAFGRVAGVLYVHGFSENKDDVLLGAALRERIKTITNNLSKD